MILRSAGISLLHLPYVVFGSGSLPLNLGEGIIPGKDFWLNLLSFALTSFLFLMVIFSLFGR